MGHPDRRLRVQSGPGLALWNIHAVIEVSLAFTVLQLVEMRIGEDPTGHPDHSPAGKGLFPAVHSAALGGITFHMITVFFVSHSVFN